MRTKPNVSIEYHDMLYESLDDEACNARRIVRSELPCSECGNNFGMSGGWTREIAIRVTPFVYQMYGCSWDDHELYRPCTQCNPEKNIPADFTPLTPEQVVAWRAVECQCPDCVRERESAEATWESLGRGLIDWPEPNRLTGPLIDELKRERGEQ